MKLIVKLFLNWNFWTKSWFFEQCAKGQQEKNPQNMLTIIHCMSQQHHEVLSTAALRLYGVLESLYGFA